MHLLPIQSDLPGAKSLKKILPVLLFLIFLPAAFKLLLIVSTPRLLSLSQKAFVSMVPGEIRFFKVRIAGGLLPRTEIIDLLILDKTTGSVLLKAPRVTAVPRWDFLWTGRLRWKKLSFENPEIHLYRTLTLDKSAWFSSVFALRGEGSAAVEGFNAAVTLDDTPESPEKDFSVRNTHFLLVARPEENAVDFDVLGQLEDGRGYTLSGTYSVDQDLADLTASFDEESWMFEGAVLDPFGGRVIEGKFDVSEVQAAPLLRFWGGSTAERVDGLFIFQGEGRISERGTAQTSGRMLMQGALDIRSGRFLKENWVRESIVQALRLAGGEFFESAAVREDFSYLFVPGSLPFEVLQSGLDTMNDEVLLQEMLVKHTDYLLEAEGTLGLHSQELDFRGRVVLLEPLSAALTKDFPQLSRFLNPQKRLAFPFVYRGLWNEAVFRLEEPYLKDKLAETQSQATVGAAAAAADPAP